MTPSSNLKIARAALVGAALILALLTTVALLVSVQAVIRARQTAVKPPPQTSIDQTKLRQALDKP